MKVFSEEQIDKIIMLKYGRMVNEAGSPSYISNKALGKLFKVSYSHVRRLLIERFR